MISETLLLILRYTKSSPSEIPFTWRELKDVLAPMYSYDMKIRDVLHILVKAYTEALGYPEFELHKGENPLERIMLAPVNGSFSLDWLPPKLDKEYSVEQFYNAMVKQMLSDLMLSRIDWLRDQGIEVFTKDTPRKDFDPVKLPTTTSAESPLWVLGSIYRNNNALNNSKAS